MPVCAGGPDELTIELHQLIDCCSGVRLHQAERNLTNDLVTQIAPRASLAAERDENQHREHAAVLVV
jgi:hypothetical protein